MEIFFTSLGILGFLLLLAIVIAVVAIVIIVIIAFIKVIATWDDDKPNIKDTSAEDTDTK